MTRLSLPPVVAEAGIVVVARKLAPDAYAELERLAELGEPVVFEVTLDSPDALERIAQLVARGRVVAAGTVLSTADAERAHRAGAAFLVSPYFDEGLVAACADRGIPFVPGIMTPSEMVRAWNAGAPAVKLFPASVTGPAFLREVSGPLGHVPVMPTGGVSAGNAGELVAAGAVAVGVGGWLTGAGAESIAGRWGLLRAAVEAGRGR